MVAGERTDVPINSLTARRVLFDQCQAMASRLDEIVHVVDSRGYGSSFYPQAKEA
jgi:hypothetical protein